MDQDNNIFLTFLQIGTAGSIGLFFIIYFVLRQKASQRKVKLTILRCLKLKFLRFLKCYNLGN